MREYLSKAVIYPYFVHASWRPRYRRAWSFSREGERLRAALKNASLEERQGHILDQLRRLVRNASENVPFYRERFRKVGFDPNTDFGFEDYAKVPPLEKEDLADPKQLLAIDARLEDLYPKSTGGSTGQPVHIWQDAAELGWRLSAIDYFQRAWGMEPGARISKLWGHHLDPKNSDSLFRRAICYLENVHDLDCFRLDDDTFARWHRELSCRRPAVLICYASALYLFARFLQEVQITPRYPTTSIIIGAEKLWTHQRTLIESVFSSPVLEQYGAREVGLIAFQRSPTDQSLEIDALNLLVEPDHGNRAPDMCADILITKLRNQAMPILRYRIGDRGRFPVDSRPGHPAFSLREVTGRVLEHIVVPDGRIVHSTLFPHMLKDYDVREFQVRQDKTGAVTLLLVPGSGLSEQDCNRIQQLCQRNLGSLSVRIKCVTRIDRTRSGKMRPVISEVAKGYT